MTFSRYQRNQCGNLQIVLLFLDSPHGGAEHRDILRSKPRVYEEFAEADISIFTIDMPRGTH